jgi:hypothetical protein
MAFQKYLKVIWLYAIGLVLVFSGLYMIAFGSAEPTGFELMIGGFFFCMIGGVYGKKKLMEVDMGGEPAPAISRQVEQIKQNVVSQLRPMETAEEEAQPVMEQPRIQPRIQAKQQPRPQPIVQQAVQQAVQQPQVIMQEPAQFSQAQVKGMIIKVMVCPDCNTENAPKNMYCSNCGKRLRAEPLPKKSAQKPQPQKKKAKKRVQAKPQPQQQ